MVRFHPWGGRVQAGGPKPGDTAQRFPRLERWLGVDLIGNQCTFWGDGYMVALIVNTRQTRSVPLSICTFTAIF